MTTQQPDSVATRLWLGTRRYAALVVVPVVVLTALGYAVGRDPEAGKFETSSVVVATDLKIRPEGLPRFAEAVFNGGEVATAAAQSLPYDANDLIPARVRLEPFENTVVLEVVGTDSDPTLAARLANEVAQAFVTELNQPGPTLGTFAIQSSAQVPTEPLASASGAVAVAVAAIAGLAAGMGLVMAMLLLRRPVLTATDAAIATGSTVLATLRMARRRDLRVAPPTGIAGVARRLFPDRAGMCGLVGAGNPLARRQVSVLVADVLAASGPVHLVTDAADEAAAVLSPERVTVTREIPPGRVWSSAPVVIDGPSEYDLPALYPPNARLALVLQGGTPAAAVAAVAGEFLPGELVGVVLVQRGGLMTRWRRRPAATGASAARTRGTGKRAPATSDRPRPSPPLEGVADPSQPAPRPQPSR